MREINSGNSDWPIPNLNLYTCPDPNILPTIPGLGSNLAASDSHASRIDFKLRNIETESSPITTCGWRYLIGEKRGAADDRKLQWIKDSFTQTLPEDRWWALGIVQVRAGSWRGENWDSVSGGMLRWEWKRKSTPHIQVLSKRGSSFNESAKNDAEQKDSASLTKAKRNLTGCFVSKWDEDPIRRCWRRYEGFKILCAFFNTIWG